ncbi:hypothetical protein [Herbidospora sp. NBRC 101105]|uniref:hypothetical protein n=1 Tax=Herbidospora sp. NBRC 101105 TaxID=3032195 RepID=UPI0024A522AC|nr:hypothetical protein [Herbidospora sp. NBRC 101105]GLX94807.1 hypothetical protein Hesp01_27570 [Herbidospora sp. NBRC 101105]
MFKKSKQRSPSPSPSPRGTVVDPRAEDSDTEFINLDEDSEEEEEESSDGEPSVVSPKPPIDPTAQPPGEEESSIDGDAVTVEESIDEDDSADDDPAPTYEELDQSIPFFDVDHLWKFAGLHGDLVKRLLAGHDDPSSRDHQAALRLVAAARAVVPDPPLQPFRDGREGAEFWQLVGKALRVGGADPVGVLAELAAAWAYVPETPKEPAPHAAISLAVRQVKGEEFRAKQFVPMVQELVKKGPFFGRPHVKVARTKQSATETDWKKVRSIARGWVRGVITARTNGLKGYEETLSTMVKNQDLKEDRARDRLADMIYCLGRTRVCVAILHQGNEIALFANSGDKTMAVSLERLLKASRLTGPAQSAAVDDLLTFMYPNKKAPQDEFAQTRRRLVKTLAYLAELESRHGRIRPVPVPTEVEGMHAEMQAATVARKKPGGKLGISKLCCVKCWLALTAGLPGLFDRPLATHKNSYPWPPPQFLEEPEVLARLLDLHTDKPYLGVEDTKRLREELEERSHSAVVNAFELFSSVTNEDVGYLSSGDEGAGEPDAHTAAYQRYLSRDEPLNKNKRDATTPQTTVVPQAKKQKKT